MERIKQITISELPENFQSEAKLNVPERTNLLINDIGLPYQLTKVVVECLDTKVIILNPETLSEKLSNQLNKNCGLSSSGVFVYPLNGGKFVRDTLENPSRQIEFEVKSVRNGLNSNPVVQIPKELIDVLEENTNMEVTIVDDVVVSGKTAKSVKNTILFELAQRKPPSDLRFTNSMPERKWNLASWLIYESRSKMKDYVDEFDKVVSGFSYQGSIGQPPMNSLSTLSADNKRSEMILQQYAQKYAKDPIHLKQFFDLLKRKGWSK